MYLGQFEVLGSWISVVSDEAAIFSLTTLRTTVLAEVGDSQTRLHCTALITSADCHDLCGAVIRVGTVTLA